LPEEDWEGGDDGFDADDVEAELLGAGFEVVPGVDCSSFGRSDAVVDSGFGGAGAEEEEDLSAGISREEMSSSGSARTAILAPTWMPFAPSCSCNHVLVLCPYVVLGRIRSYNDLSEYPVVLCLHVHRSFVCLDLQYHVSGGELVTCGHVNFRSWLWSSILLIPSFSFQLAMFPSVIVGDSEGIGKFEAAHCEGVLLKPGCIVSDCDEVEERFRTS